MDTGRFYRIVRGNKPHTNQQRFNLKLLRHRAKPNLEGRSVPAADVQNVVSRVVNWSPSELDKAQCDASQ